MTAPLRIALAGVIRLIEENGAMIEQRAGRPIVVSAVSARNRTLDRGIDLSAYPWFDTPAALTEQEDVDCVVEMIGGADGTALELARKSLAAGKSFVTANKAMIAHHGMELAKTAEAGNLSLRYEAAVAGGIPVIKGLRDGASANRIERVYGILNGTSNYILTEMEKHGHAFDDVLKEAQAIGYAEADPGFDIDGVDAAHKLAILSALSFGKALDFEGVEIDGIRNIMAADIGQAKALGYRIRLLGMARIDDGKLFQRVNPYLVPESHPLAHIDGATNAVVAVLAEITAAMRDADVSIESLIQTEKTAEGSVLLSMVTHDSRECNVLKSLAALSSSASLQAAPVVMHLLSDQD